MINLFNFPLYLLSGGLLAAWDQFAPAMFAEVEKRSFTFRNSKTRIDKAVLGNEAGLFGAAALPFQALSGRRTAEWLLAGDRYRHRRIRALLVDEKGNVARAVTPPRTKT